MSAVFQHIIIIHLAIHKQHVLISYFNWNYTFTMPVFHLMFTYGLRHCKHVMKHKLTS